MQHERVKNRLGVIPRTGNRTTDLNGKKRVLGARTVKSCGGKSRDVAKL